MIDPHTWADARRVATRAFSSSLHFAVASLDASGAPVLTPVGSVMLAEPGHVVFFELFAHGLGRRLDADPRVSLLGVDSGRWFWLRSLWQGRYARPPALRLWGTASACRSCTSAEEQRFLRRVGPLLRTRGGQRLWGRPGPVRDVWVEGIDGVALAGMAPRLSAARRPRRWPGPPA